MRVLSSFILMLFSLALYAQLDSRYNTPRFGDKIIKQQVDYKDPGRSGENVIWDFGKLKSINDEYSLIYSKPTPINKSYYILGLDTLPIKEIFSNELIIATEHNTMYYYRIKDNRLYLLGHENPTTILHYDKPLLSGVYPTNYQNQFREVYESEGKYSSKRSFSTEGQVQIMADAFGVMVLPNGDTLNNVLRIKTIQSIKETITKLQGDVNTAESTLESYKWYAKGYRYPVFETVRTYDKKDSINHKVFETAFFFPPQDHYYLDRDEENSAVLDSLWDLNYEKVIEKAVTEEKNLQQTSLRYNFYPNPVETDLIIEYYLDLPSSITFSLYAMDGRLVKKITKPKQEEGMYNEQLDCSNLSIGTYIIKIQVDKLIVNEKILKK